MGNVSHLVYLEGLHWQSLAWQPQLRGDGEDTVSRRSSDQKTYLELQLQESLPQAVLTRQVVFYKKCEHVYNFERCSTYGLHSGLERGG
jgi:hypothetical protein